MLKALATTAVQNIKKNPTPALLTIGYPTFFSLIFAGSLKLKENAVKPINNENIQNSIPRGHF